MSRESEIKTILLTDSAIAAKVGTRIYTSGEVGVNGLTFEAVPEIFNADSSVMTTILIRQREEISDGQVNNLEDVVQSSLQIIEIHGYEEIDYNDLDIIFARTRKILPIIILANSFELEWVLTTGRLRDEAALAGSSYMRQDWSINTIS